MQKKVPLLSVIMNYSFHYLNFIMIAMLKTSYTYYNLYHKEIYLLPKWE